MFLNVREEDNQRNENLCTNDVKTDSLLNYTSDVLHRNNSKHSTLNGLSNIFDSISGKFIDSSESLLAPSASSSTKYLQHPNKSSLNFATFPNDPSLAITHMESSFTSPNGVAFGNNDIDSKENIKNHDLIKHNVIPKNNSIGELDRNMKTLADLYKIKSNGSLVFSNRSFLSLSNSTNQNNRYKFFYNKIWLFAN